MKTIIGAVLLAAAAACSASTAADVGHPTDVQNAAGDSVQVNGPLRLVVKDTLARPGVFYALPSITAETGAIVVSNTRYGSLCRLAVSGRADIQGNTIGLHVTFAERLTMCTSEIRALTYDATVSGLSHGTPYDVAVIHEENGQADTVRTATVVVR
jgi:hypothetical protein